MDHVPFVVVLLVWFFFRDRVLLITQASLQLIILLPLLMAEIAGVCHYVQLGQCSEVIIW